MLDLLYKSRPESQRTSSLKLASSSSRIFHKLANLPPVQIDYRSFPEDNSIKDLYWAIRDCTPEKTTEQSVDRLVQLIQYADSTRVSLPLLVTLEKAQTSKVESVLQQAILVSAIICQCLWFSILKPNKRN